MIKIADVIYEWIYNFLLSSEYGNKFDYWYKKPKRCDKNQEDKVNKFNFVLKKIDHVF